MNRLEGSITVEAAVIVPLVLLLFGMAMNSGICLYRELKESAAATAKRSEETDVVKIFYEQEWLGDILENGR